ncbi:MAG TPA: hypothetical protein VIV60_05305 [Polyangiaceae bacterium]
MTTRCTQSQLQRLIIIAIAVAACLACSDDENASGPDPAKLAAAPDSTKLICEQVCSAADEIRKKSCGATEFPTHSECYAQCVSRYLDYPNCVEDFDASNECVRDAICNAQSQCIGAVVLAAACMQAYPK